MEWKRGNSRQDRQQTVNNQQLMGLAKATTAGKEREECKRQQWLQDTNISFNIKGASYLLLVSFFFSWLSSFFTISLEN
jgi:hypothetical protein